jgi:hypothetical protein
MFSDEDGTRPPCTSSSSSMPMRTTAAPLTCKRRSVERSPPTGHSVRDLTGPSQSRPAICMPASPLDHYRRHASRSAAVVVVLRSFCCYAASTHATHSDTHSLSFQNLCGKLSLQRDRERERDSRVVQQASKHGSANKHRGARSLTLTRKGTREAARLSLSTWKHAQTLMRGIFDVESGAGHMHMHAPAPANISLSLSLSMTS